jgi:dTDP-4-dehydrorhamnose reductase
MDAVEPDVVINCAAWTAVDAAEIAEDEAGLVNGAAVGILAEAADKRGIPFVTFSTDYVFDGKQRRAYREDDPPNPVNAYGRSKLVGEDLAMLHPRSLVVRTSWVQSGTHPCFIRKMIELGRERDLLRVVDDQTGRPTFVDDLAEATLVAIDLGATGLVHIANQGEATWYQLAEETLAVAGIDVEITPVSSSEFETPSVRPLNSVLDLTRMSELGIPALPHWQTALRSAVATIMTMYQ